MTLFPIIKLRCALILASW